jgi:diguanylate cyclase (GGDEF)-like protein
LTGALNRLGLEEGIRAALEDRRGTGAPLSLILLDLDHFKRINDLRGHAEGDRVLSALTRLVQNNTRETDRLARWGGEEFVLLCPNSGKHQALGLAEKLRELIAGHAFDVELPVTASFGVATLRADQTLEQLFADADAALYRAKHAGRNRVEVADS